MQPRKLLTTVAPSIIALLLVGAGFLTCRYLTIKVFDHEIDSDAQAYTLGRLLKDQPEQRTAVAAAYYDSEQALARLDTFAWAVPNIPTPFVGSAPAPGQQGNAHINAMQFRAGREVAMPKPARTYRIFLTGGSTAFGNGAPSDDTTIAGYLNSILTRQLTPATGLNYEVFTMANSAWASTQERIIIENMLSELQPDLVIAVSGNNDVHWGALGRNVLWFRSYADELFLSLIKAVYKLTGQPPIPENTRIEAGPIAPSVIAGRLLKNVRISAFVLAAANIDYVFVLQPTLAVSNKKLTRREGARLVQRDYFRECYGLIAAALTDLHEEHFRFVDLSGLFDGAGEQEEIFLDSYHFGDRGNEQIAEGIFLRIKDRMVSPPNR